MWGLCGRQVLLPLAAPAGALMSLPWGFPQATRLACLPSLAALCTLWGVWLLWCSQLSISCAFSQPLLPLTSGVGDPGFCPHGRLLSPASFSPHPHCSLYPVLGVAPRVGPLCPRTFPLGSTQGMWELKCTAMCDGHG